MDTQNKLIIYYASRNNIQKEINLEKDSNGLLFEFNEYEKVKIQCISEEYRVSIECYSYRENENYYQCSNNMLTLEKDKIYSISDMQDDCVIGYHPSKYQITIQKNDYNTKKEKFFKVNYNSQVKEEGMANIIDIINEYINGLTVDFFNETPQNSIMAPRQTTDYYMYKILSYYKTKIVVYTDLLLESFNNNIKTEIRKEKIVGKQNIKSIKANLLKESEKLYNVRKVNDFNITCNLILKRYLIGIKKVLLRNKMDIDYDIKLKKDVINKINNDINLNELEINKIKREKNPSGFYSIEKKNENLSLQGNLTENENWLNILMKWKKDYNEVYISINKLLNCNALVNLNFENRMGITEIFYSNYLYEFFYDLYVMLNNNNEKHHLNNNFLFSDKRSYSIFEIYGLILIQNVIKELGYSCANIPNEICSFVSDFRLEFTNGKNKIEIIYDHYCKLNDENFENGEIVSLNSKNCKPDYIVKIYDEKNNITKVLIVEMKYRRQENLINKINSNNEITKTIDDYFQLRVANGTKKPDPLIKNVLLIYPSLEEKCFELNTGEFIGINVTKNFSDSIGYNKLKSEILNCI